ncbi:MAG: DUF1549 domain-containing protein [Planctomycetaceae bacterium]|nr:DUF1549 domain-containing protein [Planctomycetaceae bacterium]
MNWPHVSAIALLIGIFFPFSSAVFAEPPLFERGVREIFATKCLDCHGLDKAKRKAELDLRSASSTLTGGESGPAVVPGQPDNSLLWKMIESQAMPPEGAMALTDEERATIHAWIAGGAESDQSTSPPDEFTLEDRNFWSFRPLEDPKLPADEGADSGLSPIDRLIRQRLRANGLTLAPEADRRTLCRRLYLDLIGLPPTPEEVDEFVRDTDPAAYVHLVDALLSSPQFGERWGRQWLDVVGYADSNGYIRHDSPRPLAWRYRDYVVDSLNSDMPYDQFWVEQLAGDELVGYPASQFSAEDRRRLTATHFLRNAPDGTDNTEGNEITRTIERYAVLESQLQITMSAMFGMTIDCARCHSHKFDPIPQRDYYALQAVFYPAFNVQNWVQPKDRWIYAAGKDEIAAWTEKNKLAEDEARALQAAFDTWLAENRPSEDAADPELTRRIDARRAQLEQDLAAVRARCPAEPDKLAWTTDLSAQEPDVHLLKRGDYFDPGPLVEPGPLSVLVEPGNEMSIEPTPAGERTTGRRLAFARWATRPDSRAAALLARVHVDRLWHGHFGTGLVPTPENFGVSGLAPTHPELLEYLAHALADAGWRQKEIHRQIVLSQTYKQSASSPDSGATADSETLPYNRFPAHRLDAEQIRDSILSVAGLLDLTMGGPPIEFVDHGNRQIVLPAGYNDGPHPSDRRSLYVRYRRSQPLTFLQVFDQATPDPNCLSRGRSTVVAQSLMLLNGPLSVRAARHFAERVLRETADNSEHKITRAFEIALARQPTDSELAECEQFLKTQEQQMVDVNNPQAAVLALAEFCKVLLASNEFLQLQ